MLMLTISLNHFLEYHNIDGALPKQQEHIGGIDLQGGAAVTGFFVVSGFIMASRARG